MEIKRSKRTLTRKLLVYFNIVMSIQSPEMGNILRRIGDISKETVRTRNVTVPNIVLQGGAINLTDKSATLAVGPDMFLQPNEARQEMISPKEALFSIETDGRLGDMFGLAQLVGQLDFLITEKVGAEELKDSSRIHPVKTPIEEQQSFIKALLPDKSHIIQEFAQTEVKMNIALSLLPVSSSDENKVLLRNRILAWQKVVANLRENLLGIKEGDVLYCQSLDRVQQELENPDPTSSVRSHNENSYKDRLEVFLNNPATLARYSGISYGEGNAEGKTKEMTEQFLDVALTINRARVLNRLHDPDGEQEGGKLNLIKTKEQTDIIKSRAFHIKERKDLLPEEKTKQLKELDKELIDLIIPIANKVRKIFPHEGDSTNSLSLVLSQEEAACAGKAEVFMAVSRFLGFPGRSTLVITTLDNEYLQHVVFELDLPSQDKLIVDGNYDSKIVSKDLTDEEVGIYVNTKLAPRIEAAEGRILNVVERSELTANYLKYRDNLRSIPPSSNVVVYTESRIDQPFDSSYILKKGEFWRLDSEGKRELWKSSIDYPHILIAPDSDSHASSSTHFNLGEKMLAFEIRTISDQSRIDTEAEECFKKAIEINPNQPDAYFRLGSLYLDQSGKEKLAIEYFRIFVNLCNKYNLSNDVNVRSFYNLANSYILSRSFPTEK